MANVTYLTSPGINNQAWLDEVTIDAPRLVQVTTLPAPQSAEAGTSIAWTAAIEGPEPRSFGWLKDGEPLPGLTNLFLSFTNVQTQHSGLYALWTSNRFGMVTAAVASVQIRGVAPVITESPFPVHASPGGAVTFTASARGTEPITWAWYHNGNLIPGANQPTLMISGLELADAGEYLVSASNALGQTQANPATLSVAMAPEFSKPPQSQGALDGSTVTLAAEVLAAEAPTWQWLFNGQTIPGQTMRQLVLAPMRTSLRGDYQVVAANRHGSVVSPVARVGFTDIAGWGERSLANGAAVPSLTNVTAIAGGCYHRLALDSDGTVRVWGVLDACACAQPPSITNAIDVSAGYRLSLALLPDGSVVQWGGNWPETPPPEVHSVEALARRLHYGALAIRSDGMPLRWGPTGLGSNSPLSTNLIEAAEGYAGALFLRADGLVLYDRGFGIPAQLASDAVAVSSGGWHHLILLSNGTLVHSGDNTWGQGNIPPAATNIIAISCGWSHDLALRADGTVLAWGSNPDGESDVPGWSAGASAVAGTGFGSLALIDSGPPRITSQPKSRRGRVGDTLRFVCRAVGALPMSYQWQKDGVPIAGANRPWLLRPLSGPDQAIYSLTVSNRYGTVTSRGARVLSVAAVIPSIVQQPQPANVTWGGVLDLTAEADGPGPFTWAWFKDGQRVYDNSPQLGYAVSRFHVPVASESDAGVYTALASNAYGSITSKGARVVVGSEAQSIGEALDAPDIPWTFAPGMGYQWTFTSDGQDALSVALPTVGSTVLETRSGGAEAVSFWWRLHSETNLNSAVLRVDGQELVRISGQVDWNRRSVALPPRDVSVRWEFSRGGVYTGLQNQLWLDQVTFGGGQAPLIDRPPPLHVLSEGSNFEVVGNVVGTEPMELAWFLGGMRLQGQTNAFLRLERLSASDAGTYVLAARNAFGEASVVLAELSVLSNRILLTSRGTQSVELSWEGQGTIEESVSPIGPWSTVHSQVNPMKVNATGSVRFYRLRR